VETRPHGLGEKPRLLLVHLLIMEAEEIQAALTHDQHLTQAGYRALLR